MSEFRASEIHHQAIYRLATNYSVASVQMQTLYPVTSPLRLTHVSVEYIFTVRSPLRLVHVSVEYLRSAQIKDMAAPLHVSEVKMQGLYAVEVTALITDVCAIVLQSKEDREISPSPGGLFQSRVY